MAMKDSISITLHRARSTDYTGLGIGVRELMLSNAVSLKKTHIARCPIPQVNS
jgi:hypothetical protein